MRILNASGCLDALTAPDVARSLDAFVSKTVTPLPREGNAPVRIAETDVGMLNSIGLANPGTRRVRRRDAAAAARARRSGVDFRRRFRGARVRRDVRRSRRRDDRAEPLVSQRRGGGGHRSGDRRGLPGSHEPSALRQAFTCKLGYFRGRARGAGRRRRRPLARQHHARHGTRRGDARATSRDLVRGPVRSGAEAGCARRGVRMLARDAHADRRHGRCHDGTRRARVDRRRRTGRRTRDRALPRSRSTTTGARGARRGGRCTRRRRR